MIIRLAIYLFAMYGKIQNNDEYKQSLVNSKWVYFE